MMLTPVVWLDGVWLFSNWVTSDASVVMTCAEALAASSEASFAWACASVVGVLEELQQIAVMTPSYPGRMVTNGGSCSINDPRAGAGPGPPSSAAIGKRVWLPHASSVGPRFRTVQARALPEPVTAKIVGASEVVHLAISDRLGLAHALPVVPCAVAPKAGACLLPICTKRGLLAQIGGRIHGAGAQEDDAQSNYRQPITIHVSSLD